MITVTKLNRKPFTINAIHIEQIEATPDTKITLTTGKIVIVSESVQEVTERVNDYYKQIHLFQMLKEGQTDVE